MTTESTQPLEPWNRPPDPCWSCGGAAEARDDIHVRCIDSKGVNCEVMNHWFTRKTWNSRVSASTALAGDEGLAGALISIELNAPECECTHDDEWCCAVVGEFCARCWAHVALRKRRAAASPSQPVVDEAGSVEPRSMRSELIHIAAESARGDGFLSPCNDIPTRPALPKIIEAQDVKLKDWANRIHQVADNLSAGSVGVAVDAELAARQIWDFLAPAVDHGLRFPASSIETIKLIISKNAAASPNVQAGPTVDTVNEAANKITDYFNAPPSVIPVVEQIINRCVISPVQASVPQCGYCADPTHFGAPVEITGSEGLWHRSELGGYYQCATQASVPAEGDTKSPRCPKCGYVMCQQFDSRPVNKIADIAIPNGKYICYNCAPTTPKGEEK